MIAKRTVLSEYLKSIKNLVFPQLCYSCEKFTIFNKELFCVSCQYNLPETDYHHYPENNFTRRFWGKVNVKGGAALYLFRKGGGVQHVIHQFKYAGKIEIGLRLGEYYGKKLVKIPLYSTIDAIVPVPLHPQKLMWRGFNQSEIFAQGLSFSMKKPVMNLLERKVFTTTQTKKEVLDRHENMDEVFQLKLTENNRYFKHILLVDDVLTTGATLTSCAKVLIDNGYQVSLATLAISI